MAPSPPMQCEPGPRCWRSLSLAQLSPLQVGECVLRLVSICMAAHSPYGPIAAPHLIQSIFPAHTPKDLRLCAGGSLGRTLK